jgi:DNA processing protein
MSGAAPEAAAPDGPRPDGPGPGEPSADRLARAALSRAVGPDDHRAHGAVRAHGARAVWEELRDRHPEVDPAADLRAQGLLGGRFVCPGDAEWPAALDALDGPGYATAVSSAGTPFGLWVFGAANLADLARRAVAVVGSRAASPYGLRIAGELAAGLADAGWTVVSGAALGIDGAAHRGALAVGGPTVAVLAGGCDLPYPRAHEDLLDEIVRSGVVVSEAPPGTPHFRRRFLARNRLIAAFSRGTVLVEAGRRSGAVNTTRHSRLLGRPVMVVPGPVTSALSAGCHRLLRDERESSVVVTDLADVLEEVGPIGTFGEPPVQDGPRDGLAGLAVRLLDAMPPRATAGVATLAGRVGASVAEVLAVLGPLAVEGLVEQVPGGFRLTALGRAPAAGPPP